MPIEGDIYVDCFVVQARPSVDLQVSSRLAQRLPQSFILLSLLLERGAGRLYLPLEVNILLLGDRGALSELERWRPYISSRVIFLTLLEVASSGFVSGGRRCDKKVRRKTGTFDPDLPLQEVALMGRKGVIAVWRQL